MLDLSTIPKVPLDDNGFAKSFSSNEKEAMKKFFDVHGFVVVSDAVSENQADSTYSELWDMIERDSAEVRNYKVEGEKLKLKGFTGFLKPKSLPPPVSRCDVDTWDSFWPYGKRGKGLVGRGVVVGPCAWNCRQSENLYNSFANIIGTDDLLVSCDRYGFMRPTVNIPFSSGNGDKLEWRTEENWVHWDLNPWFWTGVLPTPSISKDVEDMTVEEWKMGSDHVLIAENNDIVDFKGYDKVQGLIALRDTTTDDGGFCCVPGFHKILKEWAENNDVYSKEHFVSVKKDDKLIEHLQKIPMKKGSLVIWSGSLPHCNFPNQSKNPRACQYIKMFPKEVVPENIKPLRKKFIQCLLPNDYSPSPIGRRVFGLE